MSAPRPSRALQLLAGILCMSLIANLQYGWTLFVGPMGSKHHWGPAAIQLAFSIFVVTETWLVPLEAYLIDHFGPRLMVMAGGFLVGLAWYLDSIAVSLGVVYMAACIGGLGAGIVYGAAVGNALKWFPDRRGLAAGLTAAGFGAGSALTVLPIAYLIRTRGYETAFRDFGLVQGLAVMALALVLRPPPHRHTLKTEVGTPEEAAAAAAPEKDDLPPTEVLRTPAFWLLYTMFVLVATGGLMATAQLALIAHDFHVADLPVHLLGLTLPALPFALSLDRVANGLTRPFFGWISDYLGRANVMAGAFALEAIGILLLLRYAHDPKLFVVLSGTVFFAWGEIYSLFPAVCADLFGTRYATTNAGLLYTAKGTAALLVPVASQIHQMTGSWTAVFFAASLFNLIASVLALAVLKRVRKHS
ncbi:MAG TPA: oxalate/formate MFS antiporter [Polyangia bacterium]|nr:oxalate/formate MFS antiporter [Polyangia bacterium]